MSKKIVSSKLLNVEYIIFYLNILIYNCLCFIAFVFSILWIICVYCYYKQEKAILATKTNVSWLKKQMEKVNKMLNISDDSSQNLTTLQQPLGETSLTTQLTTAQQPVVETSLVTTLEQSNSLSTKISSTNNKSNEKKIADLQTNKHLKPENHLTSNDIKTKSVDDLPGTVDEKSYKDDEKSNKYDVDQKQNDHSNVDKNLVKPLISDNEPADEIVNIEKMSDKSINSDNNAEKLNNVEQKFTKHLDDQKPDEHS